MLVTLTVVGAALGIFTLGILVGIVANKEIDRNHLEVMLAEQRKYLDEAAKREQDSAMRLLEEITRPATTVAAPKAPKSDVRDRLQKAIEIIGKQAQIDTRKGDAELLLHNELELEKLNILRSILKEGHDPVITVRYRTGDEDMPLSKYVESIQKTLH